ncbi:hypothetical protein FJV76_15980 [Mesorhizobium sp. WSM4303]|nr:hypothetical protein FJV77_24730 [Mesorhizobium sp. WSM4306]TRD03648.1 hypothetical protein FJV76_15980 [Mesorhizobium sp. WSM4303]
MPTTRPPETPAKPSQHVPCPRVNRETRKRKKDKVVAKPAAPFGSSVEQAESGLKPKSKN